MDFSKNNVLTFKQGCEYLGYSKGYIYKLTSANKIPFSKPNGKSIFFSREKLEAWMLSKANGKTESNQIEPVREKQVSEIIKEPDLEQLIFATASKVVELYKLSEKSNANHFDLSQK